MIQRIPLETYDALPGVRYSHLKAIFLSPKHYRAAEEGTVRRSTAALTVGDAAHAAVFEPTRFGREYRTYFGKVRRGKVYDEWLALNAGCKSITKQERWLAEHMRDAVRGDPCAARYLHHGEAEVAMQWTDPTTGLLCKGRVDWITDVDGEDVIVGLKSTRSISERSFARQALDLGYPLQWAMYRAGHETITRARARMVEIVVENHAPWDVVVYRVPEAVIDYGMVHYRTALARVADCRRTQTWSGVAGGREVDFVLPPWAISGDVTISLDGVDEPEEVDDE